jgi:hypothetical protein
MMELMFWAATPSFLFLSLPFNRYVHVFFEGCWLLLVIHCLDGITKGPDQNESQSTFPKRQEVRHISAIP